MARAWRRPRLRVGKTVDRAAACSTLLHGQAGQCQWRPPTVTPHGTRRPGSWQRSRALRFNRRSSSTVRGAGRDGNGEDRGRPRAGWHLRRARGPGLDGDGAMERANEAVLCQPTRRGIGHHATPHTGTPETNKPAEACPGAPSQGAMAPAAPARPVDPAPCVPQLPASPIRPSFTRVRPGSDPSRSLSLTAPGTPDRVTSPATTSWQSRPGLRGLRSPSAPTTRDATSPLTDSLHPPTQRLHGRGCRSGNDGHLSGPSQERGIRRLEAVAIDRRIHKAGTMCGLREEEEPPSIAKAPLPTLGVV